MYRQTRTVIAAALAVALGTGVATGASTSAGAAEVKVALNGVMDPKVNAEAAFVQGFQDALAGSDFTVSVFPSETIGKEKERFDMVSQGLIQVNLASVGTTFGLSPLVKGVQLPFFFKDADEFDSVIAKSDLLAQMNEPLIANGTRIAGFNYIGVAMGFHNTKHPVTTVEDLSDLRFRAMNGEQLKFEESLGANGTIVSWSEVANALQTGIADGYLNPPNSALRTGHTDFLKHFTQANISPSTRLVLVSQDWFDGLPAADQATIDKAITAGIAANRAWVADWQGIVLERQKEAGVTVSELAPGERDKMVERATAIYLDVLNEEDLAKYQTALDSVRQ
ncbi:MAG: TRAP transporter substrate-binding protein [Kiloniellaceae bacterium]|mgnify:CR=1 FL=1